MNPCILANNSVRMPKKLMKLQFNHRRDKTLAVSSHNPPPPSEPVIILKGLIKPLNNSTNTGNSDDDEDDKNDTTLFRKDEVLKQVDESSGSVILDQATINAIRAKRERLRQAGAAASASDYISLDEGSNHGEAEGLSDEEPEFQGRIAMLGAKTESGKKGVFEEAIDGGLKRETEINVGEVDDEDEKDKIWEEEQFRKGLGKRMDNGSSRVVTTSVPVVQSVQHQNMMYQAAPAAYHSVSGASGGPSIGGAIGSLSGLDVMSISKQNGEYIIKERRM